MGLMNLFMLLALASAAKSFTCPEDSHSFYHADVSTGCRVYHLCENSQLQTLECPSGKAFNHHTSQCEDASSVHCYETMDHHNMHHHDMHHHHHKRAIDEYHTIAVTDVKDKVVDLYHKVKPLVIEAVKDIAPSIYLKFESEYLPKIQSTKEGVMPFIREKVLPQLKKGYQYAKRMASRLFEKAYKTYEMSNSTHITFPSMSDIASDVSNDLKPVINLGKYMSARLMTQTRAKRSTDVELPEFFMDFMEPIIRKMISQVASTFMLSGESLTSKLVLPTFYELMQDPETRFDIMTAVIASKDAFSPLTWEMLSKQTYNTADGTIIKIPRDVYEDAMIKIRSNFKPVIYKILRKHLRTILKRAAQNSGLIMDAIRNFDGAKKAHSSELANAFLDFIVKHGEVHQTSDSRTLNTYTLSEIRKDVEPMKRSALKMVADYMAKEPDSILGMLFGRNSVLYQTLLGDSEVPKKPAPEPVFAPARAPVRGRPFFRPTTPAPASNQYLGLNSSVKRLTYKRD